jgi:hypothetical protein
MTLLMLLKKELTDTTFHLKQCSMCLKIENNSYLADGFVKTIAEDKDYISKLKKAIKI